MRAWVSTVWALAVLSSCTRAPDEAAPAVDYYRSHAQDREATLRACANDPGGVGQNARCANAEEAARSLGVGSLKSLPPMGLPSASPSGPKR